MVTGADHSAVEGGSDWEVSDAVGHLHNPTREMGEHVSMKVAMAGEAC